MRSLIAMFALLSASVSPASTDPAVMHANAVGQGQAAYKEGWYGSGETRLHYVEAGKGPLVILYHGFPSFWYSWFDQMEMLKTRYRVVAVDGLGAGRSAKPASIGAYRIERLAAQLDGLARHINGKRRFVLIGHDWGAALAFAYAQAYPNRLNGVIGMSAPPYNLFLDLVRDSAEQQQRSQYMQRFMTLTRDDIAERRLPELIWRQAYAALVAGGAISEAESALFRNALADPVTIDGGMNWYRANIPAFDRIDARDRWPVGDPPLKVPAMLIWGEADQTFVPDFLTRMKREVPQLQIVRIPGVGHWTSIEQPAHANAAIARFLGRHTK